MPDRPKSRSKPRQPPVLSEAELAEIDQVALQEDEDLWFGYAEAILSLPEPRERDD